MVNKHLKVNPYPMILFGIGEDITLAKEIARYLKTELAGHAIKRFDDGERLLHQTETVRGRDVFIICTSLYGENRDSWALDYLRFVRNVAAGQPNKITVVLPQLTGQRQDVQNYEQREASMHDFYPELLKAASLEHIMVHIVVCKLHNPASATKNPPMDNVDTTFLFTKKIKETFSDFSKVAIGAGDMGGSKYARKIAVELGVPLIITDKERNQKTGVTKAMNVFTEGDISPGIDTLFFADDLISTCGTLKNGADAVAEKYPHIKNFYAAATHANFNQKTAENIAGSLFKEIWVTNTVPLSEEFNDKLSVSNRTDLKIQIISVGELLAKTINNLHNGESVSGLFTNNGNHS